MCKPPMSGAELCASHVGIGERENPMKHNTMTAATNAATPAKPADRTKPRPDGKPPKAIACTTWLIRSVSHRRRRRDGVA
jgi:hypothetical protein